MMKTRLLQYLNSLGLFAVLIVNYLAGRGLINSVSPREISDQFPSLITPEGFTFSIWALIYLILVVWTILQWFPRWISSKLLHHIGLCFFLVHIFNIAWTYAWHYYHLGLSLIFMTGILSLLVFIYHRLSGFSFQHSLESFWTKKTFSLYFSWICIAFIANTSIVLFQYQWNQWGLNSQVWTMIILFIAMIIALFMLNLFNDRPFALVFIWALIGIAAKNYTQQNAVIFHTALIVVAILIKSLIDNWLMLSKK